MKNKAKLFIFLSVTVVAVLVFISCKVFMGTSSASQTRGEYTGSYNGGKTIEYNGQTYTERTRIETYLLIGVDNIGEASSKSGGQSDFLRVVVIDSEQKRVTHIPIDRDTITPITVVGVLGNKSGEINAQICLSHAFGDGGAQSCALTVDAVSNLLQGEEIDGYLAFNMSDIAVINDWAGGVTVTVEDDLTALDPEMKPGATIKLIGDQAETFVRARMSVGDGTNTARMRRQEEYLKAFASSAKAAIKQNKNAVGELLDLLNESLITNVSRGRLLNRANDILDYESVVLNIGGTHTVGSDGFKEFYADEASLKQTIIDAFYKATE